MMKFWRRRGDGKILEAIEQSSMKMEGDSIE